MVELYKNAASVSALTLVSRILGVVRDAVIASVFGATAASDVFFVVFRPFELLRKMTSEGILNLSFIPEFSRVLAREGRERAAGLMLSALFWISVISAVVISLGIWLAPAVVCIMAPGYGDDLYARALAETLLKIMLPYGFCILVVALSIGALNSLGQFRAPAATPILLNLCIIGITLVLKRLVEPDVVVLGASVTFGGLVQLGFQLPWLGRQGLFSAGRFSLVHPGILRIGQRLLPSIVGAAAFQINLLVAGLAATVLTPGSVSCLYYAERLVQLPLALLVTSVSTVFLPVLSGRAALSDMAAVQPAFRAGIRLVMFLIIPAMAGMMALGEPIVAVLFGRGALDQAAVSQTADCLFYMSAGLWAVAGTRLLMTYHYARETLSVPFYAGLISIVSNLVLGPVLAGVMGAAGLALGVSLASVAGFTFILIRSDAGIAGVSLLVSACRALFISGIMAVLVRWLGMFLAAGEGLAGGIGLIAAVVSGAAFFFGAAVFTGAPEMELAKQVILKRQ